jgi:hypothetical protein
VIYKATARQKRVNLKPWHAVFNDVEMALAIIERLITYGIDKYNSCLKNCSGKLSV